MTDWQKSYRILPDPVNICEVIPYKPEQAANADELLRQSDILIDTIHDGEIIPERFWSALPDEPSLRAKQIAEIEEHYILERDWGANLVAEALLGSLNTRGFPCPGYFRINLARVLMDYGRFPGNTPPQAAHLDRFAINYPFSRILDYQLKKQLLEHYYDNISNRFEQIVTNKKIMIAIHTYDRFNHTGTERPLMSILTMPLGYHTNSLMSHEFFDPLYPAQLCEYTADRKLTYRLSLTLEKAGFDIAHNYPYNLPDGSIEVRSQIWFFFQYLRQRFQVDNPEKTDDPTYKAIWKMLLDTNLRSTQSENLRSYLHMFRKAPPGEEHIFLKAHDAYSDICRFLERDDRQLIKEYRLSPQRPSSIGIEVRKDYVWHFADKQCRIPLGPNRENAQKVGDVLAMALMEYFASDTHVLHQ